ncbi:MAG TPA: membrane protein insertase YidC, partial [Candidatus Acidoferrales bacterium]|nr:membrane protein insertase YidC [Candidatus Acidoferrales bacterium]
QPVTQPGAQKSAATSPAGGPAQAAAPAGGNVSGSGAPGPTAASAAVAPAPLAAASEQALIVESSVYRVELSNRGASVRSWQLIKEKDDVGKTLDLVHAPVSQQSGRWPLMLALEDPQQETATNGALYEMTPAPGSVQAPAEVEFTWSDGHLAVKKRLKFERDYVVAIETSVTLDGKPLPHGVAWRGGFGDVTAFAAPDQVRVVYSHGGSLSDIAAKKAGDEKNPEKPVSVAGVYDFAGIVDHYYAAAFLPSGDPGVTLEHWKYDREVEVEGKKETEPVVEVAASAAGTSPLRLRLFVGPKDLDVLGRIRPPLTDLVSFGSFGIIARPLFDFLKWIHRYLPNYGWAIVVMTVVINMVLYPLKYRSFHQMLKMQRVMPEIKQIQDRYKKYSMRDPRKQEMNKEVMAVYSREGVNPIGGCLPMVIQMPIWFGLYRMLDVAFELRHAPWMWWVHDLSSRDPYYILPILMCVTMYFMQKLTPVTTTDPAQQRMMNFMPLFMGFLFFRMASGLVLYILTSNVVATGQQWFLYRVMPPAKEGDSKKKIAAEKKGK